MYWDGMVVADDMSVADGTCVRRKKSAEDNKYFGMMNAVKMMSNFGGSRALAVFLTVSKNHSVYQASVLH